MRSQSRRSYLQKRRNSSRTEDGSDGKRIKEIRISDSRKPPRCWAGCSCEGKGDKWLKYLLMIHGVFFVSCLIVPMLGVLKADGPKWVGVAVLEFWCLYFCPVGILSGFYFRHWEE